MLLLSPPFPFCCCCCCCVKIRKLNESLERFSLFILSAANISVSSVALPRKCAFSKQLFWLLRTRSIIKLHRSTSWWWFHPFWCWKTILCFHWHSGLISDERGKWCYFGHCPNMVICPNMAHPQINLYAHNKRGCVILPSHKVIVWDVCVN